MTFPSGKSLSLDAHQCKQQIDNIRNLIKKHEARIQELEKKIKDQGWFGLFGGYTEEQRRDFQASIEKLKRAVEVLKGMLTKCENRIREFEDLLNRPGRR